MTDPTPREDKVDAKIQELAEDVKKMDRPDRAIPLPNEDDDGVGPVTGIVP